MGEKYGIHLRYKIFKHIYLIISAMLVIRIFRSPSIHYKNSAFALKYQGFSTFILRYKNDVSLKFSDIV